MLVDGPVSDLENVLVIIIARPATSERVVAGASAYLAEAFRRRPQHLIRRWLSQFFGDPDCVSAVPDES